MPLCRWKLPFEDPPNKRFRDPVNDCSVRIIQKKNNNNRLEDFYSAKFKFPRPSSQKLSYLVHWVLNWKIWRKSEKELKNKWKMASRERKPSRCRIESFPDELRAESTPFQLETDLGNRFFPKLSPVPEGESENVQSTKVCDFCFLCI